VSLSGRIVVLLVAGAVALGACSGDDDGGDAGDDGPRTVQPGAPGEEGRELTDEEAAAVEPPEHAAVDTAFVQDMIAHHQQALAMTALVDGRTDSDDLPLLAERQDVSQEDEVERLTAWLTDRGEDVPAADAHRDHPAMPGMATPEQLAELEAAEGPAFDRLFLELMIAHHQGAITMVADLYEAGGGLEPAVDGFAREIEADQAIEIDRMQELLATR
jgi:uncharacterized protein (DUF305 family)